MNFIDNNRAIKIRSLEITSNSLIDVAQATNDYIKHLIDIFNSVGFDIFYSLGQRNISGFIGEIYKNILASKFEELIPNPHSDGRPDILTLDSPEAIEYYHQCFITLNGKNIPEKDLFTPFKYGGLEVKCSIGSSSRYTKKYNHTFSLYEPRVGTLDSITWWAHHNSSNNLLGLYYDYYKEENNVPQVVAAFYSELNASDWNKVSHGKSENKKTSNTSLNKSGLEKMKSNCLFYVDKQSYIEQLKTIGVKF
jgi:hypothetical protein